jgi:hypothetical protein
MQKLVGAKIKKGERALKNIRTRNLPNYLQTNVCKNGVPIIRLGKKERKRCNAAF